MTTADEKPDSRQMTESDRLHESGASYYADDDVRLLLGDTREVMSELDAGSVDCIVTSPPYYGLRDYGVAGQYGQEPSPAEYVETMRATFAEARRVLADDGSLWLNIGDGYVSHGGAGGTMSSSGLVGGAKAQVPRPEASNPELWGRWNKQWGLPAKNLLGMPWRVAFALQDDGWILRNAVIWHKPNAMPTSVTDRLATRYETVFLFSKSPRYWFDLDPIRDPLKRPEALDEGIVFGGNKAEGYGTRSHSGTTYRRRNEGEREDGFTQGTGVSGYTHVNGRNPGDVWAICTQPYPEAHFATFPMELPVRCIKAGCKPGGTVLDPFSGSATTGAAARKLGRKYIGIDLNAEYHDLAKTRFMQAVLDFGESA